MRLPVSIRSGAGFLPIICRDGAGGAVYGGVMLLKEPEMGEVIGLGRRRPDGGKVVKLRKRLGMKQEELAERAHVSVRHLREIERTNRSVPGTTITAIATVLKVSPDEITLPVSNETTPDEYDRTQLKLRAVRSASELSRQANDAHRYNWDLSVDPTPATAKEMQQLLQIIRRLVERGSVTDEFDTDSVTGQLADYPNDFGLITRLARLQELLNALLASGVGVLAGSYHNQSWTEDKGPMTLPMPVPGNDGRRLKLEQILEIRFVPRDVEEKVISPDLDPKFEEIEEELKDLGLDDE